MKALILKEFRERLPVLIIGVILGFCPVLIIFIYSLSHPSDIALRNLGSVVCLLEYLALAVFYTMFITGTAIAGEVERKNLSFLFSLPVSRARIWCIKFLASLISMGLILGVFILVNRDYLELDKIAKSYRDGITLILIVLPLLTLAISIFSSSISSRETSSSGLSLLFLIVVLTTLALSSYLLDWFLFYRSFVIALIGWMLFFIIGSFIIFLKADYPDNLKKMMTAAKVSILGLLLLAILQMTLAFWDQKLPPGTPYPMNISVNTRGDMIFHVYYNEPSGHRLIFQSSLWIMNEPGYKIMSLHGAAYENIDFTPSGDIDYTKLRESQVLCHFISTEATFELWRTDIKGKRRRKLYSSVINYRDWYLIAPVYAGDRTVLFIPCKDRNTEGSQKLVILSPSGDVERTFPLPGYITSERGRFLRVLGGKLYIQNIPYSTGRTEGNYEFGALYRVDLETGAIETLYDLSKIKPASTTADKAQTVKDSASDTHPVEVVSHIYTNPYLISPSGTLQLLRRSFRNEKDHIRDELYLIDLTKGGHQELITAIPGNIRNLSWLKGKDIFIYSCRYDEDMKDTRAHVIKYDVAMRHQEILFEGGKGEILYPTREQFSRFAEYGDYAGIDGRVYPEQAEKYLLPLFDSKTKAMRVILLNLVDGSRSILLEGNGIGYAVLSPDLTQLAYFKIDRELPPLHDKYMGDASLWIRDLKTGESRKVQEYSRVEILFHRPRSIYITWRTDKELIVTWEPVKIFSVTEKGRSVKLVYPKTH